MGFTKINLEVKADGTTSQYVAAWKRKEGDKSPENLVINSGKFQLNTEELLPGTYQISCWKNASPKSDKSPQFSFSLTRVEDGEAAAPAKAADKASVDDILDDI